MLVQTIHHNSTQFITIHHNSSQFITIQHNSTQFITIHHNAARPQPDPVVCNLSGTVSYHLGPTSWSTNLGFSIPHGQNTLLVYQPIVSFIVLSYPIGQHSFCLTPLVNTTWAECHSVSPQWSIPHGQNALLVYQPIVPFTKST